MYQYLNKITDEKYSKNLPKCQESTYELENIQITENACCSIKEREQCIHRGITDMINNPDLGCNQENPCIPRKECVWDMDHISIHPTL